MSDLEVVVTMASQSTYLVWRGMQMLVQKIQAHYYQKIQAHYYQMIQIIKRS